MKIKTVSTAFVFIVMMSLLVSCEKSDSAPAGRSVPIEGDGGKGGKGGAAGPGPEKKVVKNPVVIKKEIEVRKADTFDQGIAAISGYWSSGKKDRQGLVSYIFKVESDGRVVQYWPRVNGREALMGTLLNRAFVKVTQGHFKGYTEAYFRPNEKRDGVVKEGTIDYLPFYFNVVEKIELDIHIELLAHKSVQLVDPPENFGAYQMALDPSGTNTKLTDGEFDQLLASQIEIFERLEREKKEREEKRSELLAFPFKDGGHFLLERISSPRVDVKFNDENRHRAVETLGLYNQTYFALKFIMEKAVFNKKSIDLVNSKKAHKVVVNGEEKPRPLYYAEVDSMEIYKANSAPPIKGVVNNYREKLETKATIVLMKSDKLGLTYNLTLQNNRKTFFELIYRRVDRDHYERAVKKALDTLAVIRTEKERVSKVLYENHDRMWHLEKAAVLNKDKKVENSWVALDYKEANGLGKKISKSLTILVNPTISLNSKLTGVRDRFKGNWAMRPFFLEAASARLNDNPDNAVKWARLEDLWNLIGADIYHVNRDALRRSQNFKRYAAQSSQKTLLRVADRLSKLSDDRKKAYFDSKKDIRLDIKKREHCPKWADSAIIFDSERPQKVFIPTSRSFPLESKRVQFRGYTYDIISIDRDKIVLQYIIKEKNKILELTYRASR